MKCLHCKKNLGMGNYNKNTRIHIDCKRPYKAWYLKKWVRENYALSRSYRTRWTRAKRHNELLFLYIKRHKELCEKAEQSLESMERYQEKIKNL